MTDIVIKAENLGKRYRRQHSVITTEVTEGHGGGKGMNQNEISGQIVDAAMKVHSTLGPGVLESAYEACLAYELTQRGLHVATQIGLPLIYEEVKLDVGYRIDLLVEDQVIVELKVVDQILPIHKAQLISYLKLSNRSLGLLINFHVEHLKNGIIRLVN